MAQHDDIHAPHRHDDASGAAEPGHDQTRHDQPRHDETRHDDTTVLGTPAGPGTEPTAPVPAAPGPPPAPATDPAPTPEPAPAPAPVTAPEYRSGPAPTTTVAGLLGLLVAVAVLLSEVTDVDIRWDVVGPVAVGGAGVLLVVLGVAGLRGQRFRG